MIRQYFQGLALVLLSGMVYPRIVFTDLNKLRLLARFHLQQSASIALSDVPVATVRKPANKP